MEMRRAEVGSVRDGLQRQQGCMDGQPDGVPSVFCKKFRIFGGM